MFARLGHIIDFGRVRMKFGSLHRFPQLTIAANVSGKYQLVDRNKTPLLYD